MIKRKHRIMRLIIKGYVLVLGPAILLYLLLEFTTELRGKELFYAFLPSALVFVILYVLYMLWPVFGLGDVPGSSDNQNNTN